jgi:hypothetical protein
MDLGMTLKLDYAAQREAVPGLDGWLAGSGRPRAKAN